MQQPGVCMKSWTQIIQPLHKLYTNLCKSSFSTNFTQICISDFSTNLYTNLHIWFLHKLVHKSVYPISPQTCTQICISDFSTNLYTNLHRSDHPLKVAVQEAQDKNCLKNQILTTSWAKSAQQSLISKWCTKFHFTQILSAIHWSSPTPCGQWVNLQTIVLEKFFCQRRFIIDFISEYSLRMARD
jgi:hypothetical protein